MALSFGLGILVRARGLSSQIVEDDEYHAVAAAVQKDFWYLHAHHSQSDFCAPLAIWDRVLLKTIGLGEWGLRWPVFAAGAGTLVLAAAFGMRRLRAVEAGLATGLMAVSPVMILYSRFARPYMAVAGLALLTLLAWYEARRGGGRARWWRWVCAIGGAAAIYFNIFAAPAVIALWGFAVVESLCGAAGGDAAGRTERAARRRAAIRMAAAGVGLVIFLLLPGTNSMIALARNKAGENRPSVGVWWDAAAVGLGTANASLRIWLLGSAGLGWVLLARREARLALAMLVMIAAELAAVSMLAPTGAQFAIVTLRYAISALPLVLMLIAIGLAGQIAALTAPLRGGAKTAAQWLAAGACVAVIAWCGPLRAILRQPDAFANHVELYLPGAPDGEKVNAPRFYDTLKHRAAAGVVVEIPWTLEWAFTRYGFYQMQHGREVVTATSNAVFADPGICMRGVVPVERIARSAEGAECVIIHRDIVAEKCVLDALMAPEEMPPDWRGVRERYRAEADEAIKLFSARREWRQVFSDLWTVVFEPRRGRD